MLFADKVVVVDESRVGINRKLELWRWILEYKRFRLGRSKIEYIWCGFRGIGGEMGEVSVEGQTWPKRDTFQ